MKASINVLTVSYLVLALVAAGMAIYAPYLDQKLIFAGLVCIGLAGLLAARKKHQRTANS